MNPSVLSPCAATNTVQTGFVTLLPRLQRQAERAFQFLRCPAERADCVQDALALAWAWYRRLAARGQDAAAFPATLAAFAVRAVQADSTRTRRSRASATRTSRQAWQPNPAASARSTRTTPTRSRS